MSSRRRDWCLAHASAETIGGVPSVVRPATLACRTHRQGHELDVVAIQVTPGEADRILAIGEAKAAIRPVEVAELARLDHLRTLLRLGAAALPRLLIFGRAGFSPALRRAADARTDVSLIDLDRLYHAG